VQWSPSLALFFGRYVGALLLGKEWRSRLHAIDCMRQLGAPSATFDSALSRTAEAELVLI
jgi:hypothetical protein